MREFSRNQRLAEQILRLLNELLQTASKDPRLRLVSITGVELTRDLSVARVFFSSLDPKADPSEAKSGLESAAGFLRSRVGKELRVRHTPELRFAHDDSIARGAELSALIDEAAKRRDDGNGP